MPSKFHSYTIAAAIKEVINILDIAKEALDRCCSEKEEEKACDIIDE